MTTTSLSYSGSGSTRPNFTLKLIVHGTIAAVQAAARATSTIPIVMPGINDPVGSRLIASLARPGGNVTGIATLMEDSSPKLIDLLREVVPQAKRVAMIFNPDNPSNRMVLEPTGLASGATHEVCVGNQSEDRESARHHNPAVAATARGYGDSVIAAPICAA